MTRQVHALAAWAVVVAIVVQVLLAGLAIAQLGGSGSFITHVDVGRIFGIFFLLPVVTALLARAGRRRVLQAVGLLGLFVVQMFLPYMDDALGLPIVAALHPVNSLLLFWLAVLYARAAWRERVVPVIA
jgi:heme A synthase